MNSGESQSEGKFGDKSILMSHENCYTASGKNYANHSRCIVFYRGLVPVIFVHILQHV